MNKIPLITQHSHEKPKKIPVVDWITRVAKYRNLTPQHLANILECKVSVAANILHWNLADISQTRIDSYARKLDIDPDRARMKLPQAPEDPPIVAEPNTLGINGFKFKETTTSPHPGTVLKWITEDKYDYLYAVRIKSAAEKQLHEFIRGERDVTPQFAAILVAVLDDVVHPQFWLDLQRRFNLGVLRQIQKEKYPGVSTQPERSATTLEYMAYSAAEATRESMN